MTEAVKACWEDHMAERGPVDESKPHDHPTGTGTLADSRDRGRGPTGPRTLAGKTKSKFNAVSHGILSSAVVLETESVRQYSRLVSELMENLQPVGKLEEICVEMIASAVWRCRRLLYTEAERIQKVREFIPSIAPVPEDETSDLIIRYEAHLERVMDRELARLERLQRMRCGQPVLPPVRVELSK